MSPKWYANYYDSFGQALEDKATPGNKHFSSLKQDFQMLKPTTKSSLLQN